MGDVPYEKLDGFGACGSEERRGAKEGKGFCIAAGPAAGFEEEEVADGVWGDC